MILITEDVWGDEFVSLSERYQVRYEPELWKDPERILQSLDDVQALVVRNRTSVDAAMITRGKNLRIIARAGVGLDNIDVASANARGVAVSAALGVNALSVAEHTIGLTLALTRRTIPLDLSVRAGGWNRQAGIELAGKTWGLLGFGATARSTARLLRGFGMNVLAYDPYVPHAEPDLIDLNVLLVSAEKVFENSDVISIHLPNVPQTKNIVDARSIESMKDGVYLINVGRGEVIDERALLAALKTGKVAGAGLDVRQNEPPIVGELETLANVILTPHIAGITKESQTRIIKCLADDISRALEGNVLRYAVGEVKSLEVHV
jgi:D-3-phosphoglycerate dehydrogenase